ncbi:helix-turn-helix domain-containing protein [Endozoicomonas sp.]|uniref:helix-turn-helix domain-containing protein n=1 Tax=Endozoicomonas sp. TaxID=1892382 RepID=UPI00383A84B6
MSDQDIHLEESGQSVSPGTILAEARNAQGLSVAEVAESLKITDTYVRAIEESTFDVLPQSAFVRGYIRNYARLVGLSGEQLVKEFDRYIGRDGVDTPRLKGTRKVNPLRAHSAPSPVHALALVLVVSLGGLSYYLWNYWLDAEPVAEFAMVEEVSESPEIINSNVQVAPVEVEKTAEEFTSTTVSETVEPEPAEEEPGQMVEEPEFPPINIENTEIVDATAEDAAKIMAKLGKELVIDFSGDCWVEIKDATGEILVSTVQKAGTSINLDVFPPVSVRFGNTAGVETILLDGKPVSKPNTRTRVASVLLTGNGQG